MSDLVVIGLTGPTGAGKSTVAAELARRGCKVIDCDRIAREVVDDGGPCLPLLAEEFGNDILSEGRLNRSLLASRAFSSPEKTKRLNSITHPFILRRVRELIADAELEGRKYAVVDAPLLFESGLDSACNLILAVTAPEAVRLQRIMKRDNITREEAVRRISVQHGDEYYTRHADAIIDGTSPPSKISREISDLLGKSASTE